MSVTTIITYVVAATVWAAPMPKHVNGLLVLYGSQRLSEANAEYRGYDLRPYKCGLAVMSPGDLGKVVWVRATGSEWFGPCLAVDTSAWKDFYANVYVRKEIAEIDIRAANALGFDHGIKGEAYVGLCPPEEGASIAVSYAPEPNLVYYTDGDSAPLNLFWPFPKQQMPINCFVKATRSFVQTPKFYNLGVETGIPEDGLCNNRIYSCRFVKQPNQQPAYNIPNQSAQMAFGGVEYP